MSTRSTSISQKPPELPWPENDPNRIQPSESEGFTIVSKTRRSAKSQNLDSQTGFRYHNSRNSEQTGKGRGKKSRHKRKDKDDAVNDRPDLMTLLDKRRKVLEETRWIERGKEWLLSTFDNPYLSPSDHDESPNPPQRPGSILCLGLGTLEGSFAWKSQFQLLAVLFIAEWAKIKPQKVTLYDPMFSPNDKVFLREELGLNVSDEQPSLRLETPTFIFMPHCPRFLFEDILYENLFSVDPNGESRTDGSGNLLILGNALGHYSTEMDSNVKAKIPCILRSAHLLHSIPVPSIDGRHLDVFNDLALQWLGQKGRRELGERNFKGEELGKIEQ